MTKTHCELPKGTIYVSSSIYSGLSKIEKFRGTFPISEVMSHKPKQKK